MATVAKFQREKRNYKRENQALRDKIKDDMLSPEASAKERILLAEKLQSRPRNESRIRLVRRCQLCGRPKGVFRRFKLCRCCLRKMAMLGIIPGLRKASW